METCKAPQLDRTCSFASLAQSFPDEHYSPYTKNGFRFTALVPTPWKIEGLRSRAEIFEGGKGVGGRNLKL